MTEVKVLDLLISVCLSLLPGEMDAFFSSISGLVSKVHSRASAGIYLVTKTVPVFSKGQRPKVPAGLGSICIEFCMHVNQWGEMGNKYLEQARSSLHFPLEIISMLPLYIEQ